MSCFLDTQSLQEMQKTTDRFIMSSQKLSDYGLAMLRDVTPKNKKPTVCIIQWTFIVGATGFEPATACSQNRSATGLRYTPLAFHF